MYEKDMVSSEAKMIKKYLFIDQPSLREQPLMKGTKYPTTLKTQKKDYKQKTLKKYKDLI